MIFKVTVVDNSKFLLQAKFAEAILNSIPEAVMEEIHQDFMEELFATGTVSKETQASLTRQMIEAITR